MLINVADFEKVQREFPEIYYNNDQTKILGELSFTAYYDGNKIQIDPKSAPRNQLFKGYYEIEIRLNDPDPHYGLPKVVETGGRIIKFAKDNDISTADLHLNPDNNNDYYCCLGIFTNEELRTMTFYSFFMESIFSFFAWHAYRVFFKKCPPWGEYPHGIEAGRYEKTKEILKETGRNDPCPCGSGKKFKQCCMNKLENHRQRI